MITKEVSTKSIIEMHKDGYAPMMIALHYGIPECIVSLIISNQDKVES